VVRFFLESGGCYFCDLCNGVAASGCPFDGLYFQMFLIHMLLVSIRHVLSGVSGLNWNRGFDADVNTAFSSDVNMRTCKLTED